MTEVKSQEGVLPTKELYHPNIGSYQQAYKESIEKPEEFWSKQAQVLDWHMRWDKVLDESDAPFYKWFVNGKINASYNAVDRHVLRNKRNKAAYIWVAENGDEKIITYDRIYGRVNNFAKALLDLGIKKGDRIIIYLPMFLTRQRLRTEKHRWKPGIPQRFSLVFYFKNLFLPFINFEYSETELTPF